MKKTTTETRKYRLDMNDKILNQASGILINFLPWIIKHILTELFPQRQKN